MWISDNYQSEMRQEIENCKIVQKGHQLRYDQLVVDGEYDRKKKMIK